MNTQTVPAPAPDAGASATLPHECYTWDELYWWVRLIAKRATLRPAREEAERDLAEARTYLDAARAKLAALCDKPSPTVEDLLDAETGENHVLQTSAVLASAATRLDRNRTDRGTSRD